MNKAFKYFHRISYLQYPFMIAGLYYAFKPYTYLFDKVPDGLSMMLDDFQNTLVFMGVGISFSTLQDTSKTQNTFSKKVWQSPRKGKFFLAMLTTSMLLFFVMGLLGLFVSEDNFLSELAYGLIVMAIGILGMLKTAIEMFENHRLDKNG
ncbi:hypothetical protein [Marinoscillum sp.]|uniref:hypothetical protein n=1 Tax=Marinoscillum sp. TaxID=2024838 RepID=UPI003BAA09A4